MNCYNHSVQTAVAQCSDCGKGLCCECATIYSIPICNTCNKTRIDSERSRIFKEIFVIFIGGALLTFLFVKLLSMPVGKNGYAVRFDTITYIMLYYIFAGIIAGWRTLTRLTPRMFLVLPIFGWLIYFALKLFLSFWIGLIMLPIRVVRNIYRLIKLQKVTT